MHDSTAGTYVLNKLLILESLYFGRVESTKTSVLKALLILDSGVNFYRIGPILLILESIESNTFG